MATTADEACLTLIPVPRAFDALARPARKAMEWAENSRTWLFDRADSMFADINEHALVLLSPAGMGKSVMSAMLARRGSRLLASRLGEHVIPGAIEIAAMHFFERDSIDARSSAI